MINGKVAFIMTTKDSLELVHIMEPPLSLKIEGDLIPATIYRIKYPDDKERYVSEDRLFEATPLLVARWKLGNA